MITFTRQASIRDLKGRRVCDLIMKDDEVKIEILQKGIKTCIDVDKDLKVSYSSLDVSTNDEMIVDIP